MANGITGSNLNRLLLHKNDERARAHRSAMELIALILEAVKNNSATRYPLMKYTSTNYAQLKKYLELLTGIGFIEADVKEDKILYVVSGRGLAFLRQYNVLRDMLVNAYHRNKLIDIAQEKYNGSDVQQLLQPISQH